MKHLLKFRRIATFQVGAARLECESDDPSFMEDAKNFKFGDDRLDHFFLRRLSTKSDLKRVIKIERLNRARGVSVKKLFLQLNLTEECLAAVKRVNDAMMDF